MGFASQGALIALSAAFAQIVVAILYIVSARLSDPGEFGIAVVSIALSITIAGALDYGSNALWVRSLVSGALNFSTVKRRSRMKLTVIAIFGTAWGIALLVIAPSNALWLAGPLAFCTASAQAFQVPLRALRLGHFIATIALSDRLLAAGMFALLLYVDISATYSLCISLIAGGVANAAMSWAVTAKKHSTRGLGFERINPWAGTRHYGISAIALSAQSLDIPIMSSLGAPSVAGVYGSVNRWTQPLGLLSSAFSVAAVPFVAQSKSVAEAYDKLRKGLGLLAVACFGCLGVFIAAPFIVELLLGVAYIEAVPVLRLLAVGTLAGILNQPMSTALQALGHDRVVSRVVVGAVGIQLVLVGLLTIPLGAVGAAIALVCSQFIMLGGLSVLVYAVRERSV